MSSYKTCWICNQNQANSGEHKFKSSLIKKMYGKVFKEEVSYISNNKTLRLEGPNNKKVKFEKVICENCNNSITSSHDIAFDKFIRWSNDNYSELWKNKSIDFKLIYGKDWVEQKQNFLKYVAKHAGCKIVTGPHKFDIKNISKLIYSDIKTDTFQIKFILKEGFKYIDLVNEKNGDNVKFMSNSKNICSIIEGNQIVYFAGMTTYNWLSIAWVHTQNNFTTNSPEFKSQKENLIIYSIDELPQIKKDDNLFSILDDQHMETDSKQIEFYDTFI